jgi:phenylpropionate dioxygenase-like ring-hydroxylating dioxygenase large terminal subunit
VIPNRWYAILETSEVKPGRPVGVTRLGEKLVVWRDAQGKVSCLRDRCPHRGAALSAGHIVGNHLECPFHGFQFDASGQCQIIPANGAATPVPKGFNATTYPTREAHGFVWVWWGESGRDLPPLPFFEDINDTFSHITFRDHWSVHYSRAIENQLDVVHLPFVHRTTIGRGGRTVVDGPLVVVDDDLMNIWVYNRRDDGSRARQPKDLPPPERPPFLQFRFPNIWQNHISDNVRIFISFTPIDEENTLIYMRFYQNAIRIPVFSQAVSLLGMLSSIVILRQDKRVVLTQHPKKTAVDMDERLIQGDLPIIRYRRHRRALIEEASSNETG